ncbi:hypothetical protein AAS35_002396 [Escherichia coli]|nr:hypothetical protein [Escherichia coli]STF05596.1 acetoacetate metabolism regulator (two-component system response regulator) [Escherichia coli]
MRIYKENERLGISRRALMYKLQEYGIDPADV